MPLFGVQKYFAKRLQYRAGRCVNLLEQGYCVNAWRTRDAMKSSRLIKSRLVDAQLAASWSRESMTRPVCHSLHRVPGDGRFPPGYCGIPVCLISWTAFRNGEIYVFSFPFSLFFRLYLFLIFYFVCLFLPFLLSLGSLGFRERCTLSVGPDETYVRRLSQLIHLSTYPATNERREYVAFLRTTAVLSAS